MHAEATYIFGQYIMDEVENTQVYVCNHTLLTTEAIVLHTKLIKDQTATDLF